MNYFKKYNFILITIFCLFLNHNAFSEELNLNGLRLGMNIEEAKNKAADICNFRIKKDYVDGILTGYSNSGRCDNPRKESFVTHFDPTGILYNMEHIIVIPRKKLKNLTSKIKSIYGSPTIQGTLKTKSAGLNEMLYTFCWGSCKNQKSNLNYTKGNIVFINKNKGKGLKIAYEEKYKANINVLSIQLKDNETLKKFNKWFDTKFAYKYKETPIKKNLPNKPSYFITKNDGENFEGVCGNGSILVGKYIKWSESYLITGSEGTFDIYNREKGIKKACGE